MQASWPHAGITVKRTCSINDTVTEGSRGLDWTWRYMGLDSAGHAYACLLMMMQRQH
jgi:hypothetical protein